MESTEQVVPAVKKKKLKKPTAISQHCMECTGEEKNTIDSGY